MQRSGSTGGRGFVGWVAMVLAVVLLVGPALREPTQYAMAQTNPAPAAKPPLDISGLAIIQEIAVGDSEFFHLKFLINSMLEDYSEEELKELEFNLIPAELILNSIANLAIMQMGLAGRDKFNVYRNEECLPEGTFGWALQQILGIDPKRDGGVSVEHTDFIQTPGATPECDEDHFLLTINCRQIEVILYRDYGNLAEGYEWGMGGLLLRQHSEKEFARSGLPHTEEKELAINRDSKTGKFYALYTIRIIKSDDGTLLRREQKKFVEGSPNAVWQRPMGPP